MREAFRISIITAGVMIAMVAVSLVLIGVPRLLSDDPCLRDWDVDCTTAGTTLTALDFSGTLLATVATRMVPIVLVIVIASEAVNYRSAARKRDRRRRSARGVGEEPGA